MSSQARFPFSAVVGQDEARLALLLAAIDPGIGGVLLRGDKGSAKSTLARGLAGLLPGGAPFVELPLGATEDRVLGTLDLKAALADGETRFRPGLLALAHGGVLYVDEVNLLPDHLVDVLLDVAASGINRVERDGVSHAHPARFVLVGSMNPEEGELRPQLLDRFGLMVGISSPTDPRDRAEVVRRRLTHDAGGHVAGSESDIVTRARLAASLPADLPDTVVDFACRLAVSVGAEGLRADLVLCRAAAACAGWEGRSIASAADVERVAALVLGHRRRRRPFDPPTLGESELQRALDAARRSFAEAHATPAPEPPASPDDVGGPTESGADVDASGAEPGPAGLADRPGGPGAADDDVLDARDAEAAVQPSPDDGAGGTRDDDGPPPGGDAPDGGAPDAVPAGGPDPAGGTPDPVPDGGSDPAGGTPDPVPDGGSDPAGGTPDATVLDSAATGGSPPPPPPTAPSGSWQALAGDALAGSAAPVQLAAPAPGHWSSSGDAARPGAPQGDARFGRSGVVSPERGRVVGDRLPEDGAMAGVALAATVRAAARRRQADPDGPVVTADDVREPVRARTVGRTVIVAVDASGSMGTHRRVEAATGAVVGLLADAYLRRDRVALVTFRGDSAEVALPPTASVELARARLAELPTGGVTPLADGINAGLSLARRAVADGWPPLLVLITDGRATGAGDALDRANAAAAEVAAAGLDAVVIDAEDGPHKLGLAHQLATAMGARHLRLDQMSPDRVESAVRDALH
jgi:magnesium chelatase subunit D